ncbi:MAG TPA: molybdopterin-dependent oxidoreductase [Steroidobacteraceae bacterium]|jgi:anaerobic selenocysteine-containing dehydrogenase
MHEARSFCRTCIAGCGVILSIDDGQIASMRGDRDHPISEGYVCFKGLQARSSHHGPTRLLHPLKRRADGQAAQIAPERAFDEIAAKLRVILDRDGPQAIGLFRGTGAFHTTTAFAIHAGFLEALGSSQLFTTLTIDQSAKMVAAGRLGSWHAGKEHIETLDAAMIFGCNPLISHSAGGLLLSAPVKRLKQAKARGMKLVVIDPRRTETAQHADLFIQPYPGEDPSIAAGILRIILNEGWHDAEFCERYVTGLQMLRRAIEPFTPAYVAARAGIPAEDLTRAARMVSIESRHGTIVTGTGPNMSPHSNLAEHLAQCIDVVCGRFKRPGDRMPNPDPLAPNTEWYAEVVPASRPWDLAPPSRIRGAGNLFGERLTGTLADEILTPGPGQIKALIVNGANIANSVPGKTNMLEALGSLELLVVIDPHLTATARLAHYIIPTTLQYERADIPITLGFPLYLDAWTQYTPAIVEPPKRSEVVDDWVVFWSLAKRLGLKLNYAGAPLDMRERPTSDTLLHLSMRNASLTLDELKARPNGIWWDPEHVSLVKSARPGATGRFTVAPQDVLQEIGSVLAETPGADGFAFRLAVRRSRDLNGSIGHQTPAIRRRNPHNPLYMNPDDMAHLGIAAGDWVDVSSQSGCISAIAASDPAVRSGVVSMSHNWGDLANDPANYRQYGASTNFLIRADVGCESINAMPRMSAIPVNVRLRTGYSVIPPDSGITEPVTKLPASEAR